MGSKTSISTNTGAHLELVRKHIASHNVLVYSKSSCPYCYSAKDILDKGRVKYVVYELDRVEGGRSIQKALYEITGQRTVPNIFINHRHIGGCDDLTKLYQNKQLKKMLDDANIPNSFIY